VRARNLKPGFFKNEILGSADPLLGILFEGLWCMADREGRLEDRPLRICATVFPYRRSVTEKKAAAMLRWLHDEGFIARYEVAGKRYIQVLEFLSHQNPHKNEAPSKIPALTSIPHGAYTGEAPEDSETSTEVARKSPGLFSDSLNPSSLNPLSERESARGIAGATRVQEPERTDANTAHAEAGVRRFGTALTEIGSEALDEWRRSVPDVDAASFGSWIAQWERRKGRAMPADVRLLQARDLSKRGDAAYQAALVAFCIGQDYATLIPNKDFEARTKGSFKTPTKPEDAKATRDAAERDLLERLKAGREARGLGDFRDPYPQESSGSYETALRIEASRRPRKASA
jgi:hypothetical protein